MLDLYVQGWAISYTLCPGVDFMSESYFQGWKFAYPACPVVEHV